MTTPMPASVPSSPGLWFLNTFVRIRVSCTEGHDGTSILEHLAAFADSPPLHVHTTEDEIFHVLEGRFRFVLEGQQHEAGPGAIVLIPRGASHTYRVESTEGGRFLTITRGSEFERFVRALSRPAERAGLPTPSGPPSPEQMAAFSAVAESHGIRFLGPPLH